MKIGMILRPGIEADDLQRIIKEDFELDSMDKMVVKEEDKDDEFSRPMMYLYDDEELNERRKE